MEEKSISESVKTAPPSFHPFEMHFSQSLLWLACTLVVEGVLLIRLGLRSWNFILSTPTSSTFVFPLAVVLACLHETVYVT